MSNHPFMPIQHHTYLLRGPGSNSPPEINKLGENARDSSGVLPVGRWQAVRFQWNSDTSDSSSCSIKFLFCLIGLSLIPSCLKTLKPLGSFLLEQLGWWHLLPTQISKHCAWVHHAKTKVTETRNCNAWDWLPVRSPLSSAFDVYTSQYDILIIIVVIFIGVENG